MAILSKIVRKIAKKAIKKKPAKKLSRKEQMKKDFKSTPKPKTSQTKVKLPKSYVSAEEKFVKNVDAGKTFSKTELERMSKIIKLNNKAEVRGPNFEAGQNFVKPNDIKNVKEDLRFVINELGDLGYRGDKLLKLQEKFLRKKRGK